MRNLLIIISMLFFNGCNSYDFQIKNLTKEKVRFDNLPVQVADYIKNPQHYKNGSPNTLVILNSVDTSRYILEVKSSFVSSWIDYIKIIDAKNQITYRINREEPDPFIIFDNKLYLPDRYNIFTTVDDLNSLEFTRYDLK